MDIEKYKKAKRIEAELSPIIDIVNILSLNIKNPEAFKKLVVPRVLNGEILPIIAKYGDKLQKEFEEL